MTCMGMYFKVKNKINEIEKLTDEKFEEMLPMEEEKLSKVILINNVVCIVSKALYSLLIFYNETAKEMIIAKGNSDSFYDVVALMIIFLHYVFFMTINVFVVGLEKKIDPEK